MLAKCYSLMAKEEYLKMPQIKSFFPPFKKKRLHGALYMNARIPLAAASLSTCYLSLQTIPVSLAP
jgi:hypothetical protein